jgi:hypothetical protein
MRQVKFKETGDSIRMNLTLEDFDTLSTTEFNAVTALKLHTEITKKKRVILYIGDRSLKARINMGSLQRANPLAQDTCDIDCKEFLADTSGCRNYAKYDAPNSCTQKDCSTQTCPYGDYFDQLIFPWDQFNRLKKLPN